MATRTTRTLMGLSLLFAVTAPCRAQYALENVFPGQGFAAPVDIQNAGDDRVFVAEKRGVIWVVVDGQKYQFLDISAGVTNLSEAGFAGLAFSPNYANDGVFYVSYMSTPPTAMTVARYTVSATDSNQADIMSQSTVMAVPQVNTFHNGGQLVFDSEGYLCFSLGDDGVRDDAQDLTTLTGSILRIIPKPIGYSIPHSNPFYGNANGYRQEIFCYGFRNPWRFSMDEENDLIWVADVGESQWEEVNLAIPGRNYGWPRMEGPVCFAPQSCDTAGLNLVPPLHYYDHNNGRAIIGGFVYQSPRLPELVGRYIFGDYVWGTIHAVTYIGDNPPIVTRLMTGAPNIFCFGRTLDGDVYVGAADNKIHRLVRTATAATPAPPPVAGRLLANYPNPFNPATSIPVSMSEPGRVTVSIHDVRGREVVRLFAGNLPAGTTTLEWDGRNAGGRAAASGVYVAVLKIDGDIADSRRITLVK